MSIGHSFIELPSVDSTNNYAMAQAQARTASHGTLIFAHEQWAGKGQRGKSWTSQPGENIILSLILEPGPLPVTQYFPLSCAIALACLDFFSRYAGPDETRIKWPNDIYWRDRKAGGILIENSLKGDRWAYSIAGMGININQTTFPPTARNPVSLRQITGRSFDAVELARELGACLDLRYQQFLSEQPGASDLQSHLSKSQISNPSASTSQSHIPKSQISNPPPPSLLEEYNSRLYKRGQSVRLKKENAVFTTEIQGVRPTGELVTRDTLEREFSFGEVEWVF